jgi:arsenate reductase (thioredoxin)
MPEPVSPTAVEIPLEQRLQLRQAADRLKAHFAGQLNAETIERFLTESFDQISAGARLPNWLPLLAERFAKERLRALVRLELGAEVTTPAVLFLCVQNAGRSQMAAGWLRHLAGDDVDVFSGGSEPAGALNRGAVAAMAEVGIDISDELPKPWADEIVRAADVVVTMGCGDACPLYPGKRYVDWEIDDPAGKEVEEIRAIRDEIGRRVRALMAEIGVGPATRR